MIYHHNERDITEMRTTSEEQHNMSDSDFGFDCGESDLDFGFDESASLSDDE